MHGAVERKIKTIQECLEKCDFANLRCHATGLQTLMKLIENEINNVPLGYSYGRDANNSPLLKLIFPNMLKIGRMNHRALDGPVRMPKGPGWKGLSRDFRPSTKFSTLLWCQNFSLLPNGSSLENPCR